MASETKKTFDPQTEDLPMVDRENPWPGLTPFAEESSAYFFGRDGEADELTRAILRSPVTVLSGKSGLGKTSLLRAGVFPRLREQECVPIYLRLNHVEEAGEDLPLVEQMFARLREALEAAEIDHPDFDRHRTLWELFYHQDTEFLKDGYINVTPILVFDQFEEIFTLGRRTPYSREQSTAFLRELASLVEGTPPEAIRQRLDEHPDDAADYVRSSDTFKILICLREDFLAELDDYSAIIPSLRHSRMLLRPFNGEQAMDAVRQPAGHLVSPDVAERIVRFVAGEERVRATAVTKRSHQMIPLKDLRVEPSLLSLFCRELNGLRIGQGEEQITAGLLRGSREQILSNFYARTIGQLPEVQRRYLEENLVTEEGHRNSLPLTNVMSFGGFTREGIMDLVNKRILRLEESGDHRRVELSHDVLTSVVQDSRAQARSQEQITREREAAEKERAETRRKMRNLSIQLVAVLIVIGAILFIYAQQRLKRQDLEVRYQRERAARADDERARFEEMSGKLAQEKLRAERAVGALLDFTESLISEDFQFNLNVPPRQALKLLKAVDESFLLESNSLIPGFEFERGRIRVSYYQAEAHFWLGEWDESAEKLRNAIFRCEINVQDLSAALQRYEELKALERKLAKEGRTSSSRMDFLDKGISFVQLYGGGQSIVERNLREGEAEIYLSTRADRIASKLTKIHQDLRTVLVESYLLLGHGHYWKTQFDHSDDPIREIAHAFTNYQRCARFNEAQLLTQEDNAIAQLFRGIARNACGRALLALNRESQAEEFLNLARTDLGQRRHRAIVNAIKRQGTASDQSSEVFSPGSETDEKSFSDNATPSIGAEADASPSVPGDAAQKREADAMLFLAPESSPIDKLSYTLCADIHSVDAQLHLQRYALHSDPEDLERAVTFARHALHLRRNLQSLEPASAYYNQAVCDDLLRLSRIEYTAASNWDKLPVETRRKMNFDPEDRVTAVMSALENAETLERFSKDLFAKDNANYFWRQNAVGSSAWLGQLYYDAVERGLDVSTESEVIDMFAVAVDMAFALDVAHPVLQRNLGKYVRLLEKSNHPKRLELISQATHLNEKWQPAPAPGSHTAD